jgi:hypothetical protein
MFSTLASNVILLEGLWHSRLALPLFSLYLVERGWASGLLDSCILFNGLFPVS